MFKRIRKTGLIVLLLTSVLSFYCAKKTTDAQKGVSSQTLLIGNQTEPQDLDPHIVTGVPEFRIMEALFEGLVILDPKDLKPLPGAAKSWDISTDGLTYTFHLRNNGLWSNGDTVKSGDFLFSFQRILSAALGSEYAYMLYCLEGAEDYNKSKLKDFSTVGAKAPDDTTLVLKLARPTPYFLSLIAHHSWFPVNPATILKYGKIDSRGTQWTRPGNFVGNGQFVLTKWEINRVISVNKNENYWDASSVRLNSIKFYPIENNQTEERAFRTGQLHMTTNLPPAKINWYRSNNPAALRIDPYLGTYYYLVNVTKKPLDNVNVRKALSLAIDRKAITENVLKGGQIPAVSFTPPNTGGYTCDSSVRFDTLEARRLLKEAGYSQSNPVPPVSLLYNTSEQHHTVAQAIQQMWKKYLGIDVTLVNQEWKVYLSSKREQNFDVARMGWIGDYNDPNTFLDMWLKGGGNNNTGWFSAAYDSLIGVASKSADPQVRFSSFSSAEKILLEQLPVIPIYFYTNVFLKDPSVKGWYPNLLSIHNYKFVYLE